MAIERLKYFIPLYGTRLLLKRVERLERETTGSTLLPQYYEARMDALYEAIMHRLSQSDPIYFNTRPENHESLATKDFKQAGHIDAVTGG